jgi:hypothetical protein
VFELSFILMAIAMVLLSVGFWLKGKEAGRIEAQSSANEARK